jgi:hypothetical protein
MGILQAAGMMNSDATPAREPESVNESEREEAALDSAVDEAPKEEKGEFVAMSKIQPKKPGSRRYQAESLVEQRLKEFSDNQTKERQTYEARASQYAQEVAQLRGQIEAMQRMPSASQAQPTGPDPVQMRREARAALDAGKFDEYERMRDEAAQIEADRRAEAKVEAKFKEFRQQQPQPINPAIQMLISQHRNVAFAGERGMRAVMLKDQELGELYNVPPGPERVRKAFEIADGLLGSQQQPTPPSYSRDSAAALSGVPTGRSSNGGSTSEPGVTLTSLQLEAARAAGMDPASYVRWSNPQKYFGK